MNLPEPCLELVGFLRNRITEVNLYKYLEILNIPTSSSVTNLTQACPSRMQNLKDEMMKDLQDENNPLFEKKDPITQNSCY
jgi:hypothetical protein